MKKSLATVNKLLLVLGACFLTLFSARADDHWVRYGTGAVAERDGKVYFEKTFRMKNLSAEQIYAVVTNWAKERYTHKEGFASQVLPRDSTHHLVQAVGDEYLVFQSSFMSLDRAKISYLLQAEAGDRSCVFTISRIRYRYDDDSDGKEERYTAEEKITDKVALKKGKFVRQNRKFRISTIDLMNQIFDQVQILFDKEVIRQINTTD